MGATRHFPNHDLRDDYVTSQPMVITHVSKSGKTIKLESLKAISTYTGHEPMIIVEGRKIWNHVYTAAEIRQFAFIRPFTYSARLNQDGEWIELKRKRRITIGRAVYAMVESESS